MANENETEQDKPCIQSETYFFAVESRKTSRDSYLYRIPMAAANNFVCTDLWNKLVVNLTPSDLEVF